MVKFVPLLFSAVAAQVEDASDTEYFAITSAEGGCLTYTPHSGQGMGNIEVQDCNTCTDESTSCDDRQGFYRTPDGMIKTRYDNFCLDMGTSGKGPGGTDHNVYVNNDCAEVSNRLWDFEGRQIKNRQGLCMNTDMKRGKNIKGYKCHDNDDEYYQRPSFEKIKVKKMTMCMRLLGSTESADLDLTVKYSKGYKSSHSHTSQTTTDISSDIKTSVTDFEASASAEVSTDWKQAVSDASYEEEEMKDSLEATYHCHQPCFIYQGQISITLSDGSTSTVDQHGPLEEKDKSFGANDCHDYTPGADQSTVVNAVIGQSVMI